MSLDEVFQVSLLTLAAAGHLSPTDLCVAAVSGRHKIPTNVATPIEPDCKQINLDPMALHVNVDKGKGWEGELCLKITTSVLQVVGLGFAWCFTVRLELG